MKRISFTLSILLVLLASFHAAPVYAGGNSDNYAAVLSGRDEVPARDTNARGIATFKWNVDGSLDFTLAAANIENVVAGHVHCGAAGVNGPVGVTLFSGGTPGSGRFDGVRCPTHSHYARHRQWLRLVNTGGCNGCDGKR